MSTKVKNFRKSAVAVLLAALMLFSLLPCLLSAVPAAAKTYDGRNRVGCWWWYQADASSKTTREKYLNLLEQTGVTEIYYEGYTQLWDESKHKALHTFVDAAAAHGMRVSCIMDDPAMVKDADRSEKYMIKLRDGFKAYTATYPDDKLYGIHFDVEPGGYNKKVLQAYCDNLVQNAKTYLVDEGIYTEFDVNPAWSGCADVVFNGETGFYNAVCSVIANGKGTLSLMSYRSTAENVLARANAAGAVDAAVAHNTDFTYGIETGDSGEGDSVDIHNKDKATLCAMMDAIRADIDSHNYAVDVGIAVHHTRALYKLAGNFPTTVAYTGGGADVTRPSYTTKATTAPTDPGAGLTKLTLWESDEFKSVTIEEYIGVVEDAALNAAIQADIAENGVIEDNEYYEIVTTGYTSGKSGYAVAGFFTDGYEFWGSDTASGCCVMGEEMDVTAQKCLATATDKRGNLLAPQMNKNRTKLAYFSDADGWKDKVFIKSLQIYVYRKPDSAATVPAGSITTKATTTPTQAPLAPAENPDGEKQGLAEKLIAWFEKTFSWLSSELLVFLISMVPILECRGGLLAAAGLGVDIVKAVPICIIGNLIPVPFILWFITPIFNWMKKTRLFRGLVEKIEKKAEGKTDKLENGAFWALVLFVGIPLPGTGAWTGSLIASMLNMKFKKAFPAVIIGVLLATVIMSAVSYGLFGAIAALF